MEWWGGRKKNEKTDPSAETDRDLYAADGTWLSERSRPNRVVYTRCLCKNTWDTYYVMHAVRFFFFTWTIRYYGARTYVRIYDSAHTSGLRHIVRQTGGISCWV